MVTKGSQGLRAFHTLCPLIMGESWMQEYLFSIQHLHTFTISRCINIFSPSSGDLRDLDVCRFHTIFGAVSG